MLIEHIPGCHFRTLCPLQGRMLRALDKLERSGRGSDPNVAAGVFIEALTQMLGARKVK
jgi:hypothetical protein